MIEVVNDAEIQAHIAALRPGSGDSLLTRFQRVVVNHANRPAITFAGQSLSYAELNRRANGLANRLIALKLPQESLIGIWLDRTPDMIVSMLAVLKAGFTYLPLEATYPIARIEQTLSDARPALLITDPSLAAKLSASVASPLLFCGGEKSDRNPCVRVDPSTSAYVIYTSGSTGVPKGVRVSHTNVIRLFDQTQDEFSFSETDVWTMFHSFAFDFSVWEMWGPLLNGGRLVMVPFETTRSPLDFYQLLSRERVTVLNQTPSAFLLINQVEEKDLVLPLALRLVIFGGEALKFSTLKSWFRRHNDGQPRLVNCYGITETTVHVTVREVDQADAIHEQESLIGKPIGDLSIQLLDEHLRPVLDGDIGEICVGGPGVSLGYLNRPQLTAERFIVWNGERLYRSGDLARRRADGELVYLGRRDEQVKISGFRIELGEVEAAIAQYPGIAQVRVVPFVDDAQRTQLAAYFTQASYGSVSVSALARTLKAQLPAQMLPASYNPLAAMPLTSNGKLDRRSLPAPVMGIPQEEEAQATVGSDIEEAVLALVREVVGVPTIELQDFFFSVGGHSLLGTQFVLKARQAFSVKLTLRDLFETETIADIAARIEELIMEDIEAMTEEEAIRQFEPQRHAA